MPANIFFNKLSPRKNEILIKTYDKFHANINIDSYVSSDKLLAAYDDCLQCKSYRLK